MSLLEMSKDVLELKKRYSIVSLEPLGKPWSDDCMDILIKCAKHWNMEKELMITPPINHGILGWLCIFQDFIKKECNKLGITFNYEFDLKKRMEKKALIETVLYGEGEWWMDKMPYVHC